MDTQQRLVYSRPRFTLNMFSDIQKVIRLYSLFIFALLFVSGPLYSQVNVDNFGAVGDGTTDDSSAISAAIATSGEGARIVFSPNKTYLVCKVIKPQKDQTIDLMGATMKKCDELVTQVVSYDGAGLWEVDDASEFEIGMWLSISSNGGYDVTTGPMEITDITANEITSSPSFQEPAPGSTMTSDSPLFVVEQSGVTIQNFNFDGNYPNNDSILKWDTSVMLLIAGENTVIKDGSASSIPGDFLRFGIGSDGSLLQNVTVTDGSGVFAHLTGVGFEGTEGITIHGNDISNLGQEAARQEHATGAVEWSSDVGNVYVTDNEFRDLPIAAIGMDDDPRASEVIIRNNTARNSEGFISMLKRIKDFDDSDVQMLEISNNMLFDTGLNFIHVSDFPAQVEEPIRDIRILNNRGVNTQWDIQGVDNFEFRGNEMLVDDLESVGGPFDFFFSQATLRLRSMGNAVIDGNTFEGNWRQISIENRGEQDGLGYTDMYDIRNNTFREFFYSAIQGRADQNNVGGFNEIVNWTTSNNNITSTVLGQGTGISPSGVATIFPAGGQHTSNCVFVGSDATDTYATWVYGLNVAGITGAGGSFSDNIFVNQNGRTGLWGGGDQALSLEVLNSTVSDFITLDFVNSNGGIESGTIVDSSINCALPAVVGLESPEDGATGQSINPELVWQQDPSVGSYQVQVSTQSDFSNLVVDITLAGRNSIQLGALESSTQYFWRVRAMNTVGSSEWSNSRLFTTGSGVLLPGIVNLSSPADNAVDQDVTVPLVWTRSDHSTSYRLQVSDQESFASLVLDITVNAGTSFNISGLTVSQGYWWRVKGVSDQGESPSWSAVWKFTTKATNTAIGDEIPGLAEVAIYPNPASRNLTINLGDALVEEITIFDSLGRSVRSRAKGEGIRGQLNFAIGDLPPGAFYIEIKAEGGSRIIPLAILR